MRKLFGIGIIIRLICMPFLAHPDLLLSYGRSWEIAFGGANAFQFGQPIPHILQAIWLKFIGVFTGGDFFLPLQTQLGEGRNYDLMTEFVTENPAAQLNIFFFKLLYLGIDLLVVYVLVRLWKEQDQKRRKFLFTFYWLNPILIFAVYAFGRYEVLVALFMILILLFLKQLPGAKGVMWAGALFGLVIVARPSLLILFPIFLILAGRTWVEKAFAFLLGLTPYMLSVILQSIVTPTDQNVSQLAITTGSHFDYLVEGGIQINDIFQLQLSIFVIAYTLIAYAAYSAWRAGKNDWQQHALFYSLALIAYFGTSFYHPHYLAWLVVPLGVTVTYFKLWRYLRELLFAVVMLFPFLLLTWGRDILMGLFIPLSVELGNKDLSGVFANFIDPVNLNSIVWSLLAAIWFLIVWQIWRWTEIRLSYE